MATTFQQFFDKENVGASASVKNRIGLSMKGQQDNTSLATPRRALGNVNRNFNTSKQTPLAKKALKTPLKVFTENSEKPKPRKALSSISENKQLSGAKPKKTVEGPQNIVCNPFTTYQSISQVDEIEHAHRLQDIEDDYEDIYPKKERVSTYFDKLISWRPSCFKRWDIDDDSEYAVLDDDDQELLLIDEIPVIPTMTNDPTSCEEALYSDAPEPMPEIDISLLDLSDFLDLPQELDEKILL